MTGMSTREALAAIADVLDRVEPDRSGLGDGERLDLVQVAGVVAGRVEALRCARVAEADAADSFMRAKGTPTSSWLSLTGRLSRKESAGLVYRARDLAADAQVRHEVLAGTVGVEQARAISRVMRELPDSLSEAQRHQAGTVLLGHARRVDSAGLAQLSSVVLAEVAPEVSGEVDAQRLRHQAETARRERSLWFVRDRGSIRFRGSLPVAEAEGWAAIIDAHVQSQRRNVVEVRDPRAEAPTPEQRRADALVAMIRAHQSSRWAPSGGGDRPRILVTLDYEALIERAVAAELLTPAQQTQMGRPDPAQPVGAVRPARAEVIGSGLPAGVLASGHRIGAGELRRLCCDADLIPVVLGSASEVLDVGRLHRLVTRGLRTALTHRDRGCICPSCDTPPTACEAHHLVPWWAGGRRACRTWFCSVITITGLSSPIPPGNATSGQSESARTGSPNACHPDASTLSGHHCATSASALASDRKIPRRQPTGRASRRPMRRRLTSTPPWDPRRPGQRGLPPPRGWIDGTNRRDRVSVVGARLESSRSMLIAGHQVRSAQRSRTCSPGRTWASRSDAASVSTATTG